MHRSPRIVQRCAIFCYLLPVTNVVAAPQRMQSREEVLRGPGENGVIQHRNVSTIGAIRQKSTRSRRTFTIFRHN
jgi:hypothetical protein